MCGHDDIAACGHALGILGRDDGANGQSTRVFDEGTARNGFALKGADDGGQRLFTRPDTAIGRQIDAASDNVGDPRCRAVQNGASQRCQERCITRANRDLVHRDIAKGFDDIGVSSTGQRHSACAGIGRIQVNLVASATDLAKQGVQRDRLSSDIHPGVRRRDGVVAAGRIRRSGHIHRIEDRHRGHQLHVAAGAEHIAQPHVSIGFGDDDITSGRGAQPTIAGRAAVATRFDAETVICAADRARGA